VEAFLADLRTAAGTDADQGVAEWFEANSDLVDRRVGEAQDGAAADELYRIFQSLQPATRAAVLRDLDGFARVSGASR